MTSPAPPAPVQVGIKAGDPQVVGIARSLVLVDGVFHKVAGPHEHPEGQPQTGFGRTPCGACRALMFQFMPANYKQIEIMQGYESFRIVTLPGGLHRLKTYRQGGFFRKPAALPAPAYRLPATYFLQGK